jgi:cephalosporin-C deacetylase-like acetyl esterase
MRRNSLAGLALLLLAAAPPQEKASWDLEALGKAPKTQPSDQFKIEGLQEFFYEGLPYQGKPTRVFAFYGAPKVEGKVPAMVLVHGGGGTALSDWVKLWVSRGFAAIAMDLCGCVPRKGKSGWERHPDGGPPGWGGFDQVDQPEKDQWTYHAVADVILAHSLLRSFPEIDAEQIGITGISWGGYLTCITASVDARFKFAAPVYGCGFLGDDSTWLATFEKMGREKAAKWLGLWDPSQYLKQAKMPFLWVNGTNDFAYPLDSYQKSYRLPETPRTLAIRIRMAHAHGGPGEKPEEIHAFANAIFKGGVPLAKITGQGEGWATFESKAPIAKAELCFTKDVGKWQPRKWESAPAAIDGNKVTAVLPEGVKAWYLNLVDDRGLVVSTEHVESK